MSHSTQYSGEQERKEREVINQKRKRDSSVSDEIKIGTLKQPTTDSALV